MFNTLRTKLFLLVASIVLLTMLTIIYIGQQETKKAFLQFQDENIRNHLHTVALSVEGSYKSLRYHRDAMVQRRKEELHNMVSVAMEAIEDAYDAYHRGELSEEKAKKLAMERVRLMRYDQGVGYLWINDMLRPIPRMLMHPTRPELNGKITTDLKYYSAGKKRKHLLQVAVNVVHQSGEGYIDYVWPKPNATGLLVNQPKLSYVKLFRPWGWVVGTGVYIDDIEEEAQKSLEAILNDLRDSFSKQKFAGNGYMYLFSGEREFLVHPTMSGINVQGIENPMTGNPLIEDIIHATKTGDLPYHYLWEKPDKEPGEFIYWKRAYAVYFKPLDWYIVSSIYVDDIMEPAKGVVQQIVSYSLIPLVVAFALSFLLSRNITSPLNKLTVAARKIRRKGLDATKIPIAGTVETKELAQVFDRMIQSIQQTMREKERILEELADSNEELSTINLQLEKEVWERTQTEKELSHLRNLFGNIIDSMPSVLIGVNPEEKISHWNRETEKETGILAAEAIGKSLKEVYPRLSQFMANATTFINNRTLYKEEKIGWMTDKGLHFVDITIYPLKTNGVQGVVIRIDDVTERVRMEEMMLQTEKMSSIGGLAAGMAHEINNPLGIILQGVQNAERRLSLGLAKNREVAEECDVEMEKMLQYLEKRNIFKYLEGIQDAGVRASKILDHILNFSGRSHVTMVEANINLLLDETVELAMKDKDLAKKFDFRTVEIVRDYDQELALVPCIRSEIKQVFLNLLLNGAYAMNGINEEGYQPVITLRTTEEVGFVVIEIIDNGPGMNEESKKKAFEPFFTTMSIGNGTGLGLSVSYFLITNNHKGKIEFESKIGEGTAFRISLPL